MGLFRLRSSFKPAGDQPEAIDTLAGRIREGAPAQTLLGVTGSGKTFAVANAIARLERPTLVLSPNKVLAAQLYAEFKSFFPDNAVEFFISYYDYYQPEAYVPATNTYIEKDASINEDIDRLRLSATNLELGITCWIPARIDENGSTTVPSRTFSDLVNTLPSFPETLPPQDTLVSRSKTMLTRPLRIAAIPTFLPNAC